MNRSLRVDAVLAAATVSICCACAGAQSVTGDPELDPVPLDGSLPSVLEAGFADGKAWSTDFELPAGPGERVKLHVWFDNIGSEQLVHVEYFVTKAYMGDILFAGAKKSYSCPYRVTAACRAAGSSDRMFIAGWSERSKKVHVEEWTLENVAIAVAMNPAGQAVLGFSPPSVRRELIFTSSQLAPIEDMVFHHVSEDLLLLEFGPQSRLYRLPLATLVPTVLLDESSHPDFKFVSNIRLSFHDQMGYVLYGRDAPEWSYENDPWFLVVTDSDLDGSFELGTLTRYEADEFAAVFPDSGWVSDY